MQIYNSRKNNGISTLGRFSIIFLAVNKLKTKKTQNIFSRYSFIKYILNQWYNFIKPY